MPQRYANSQSGLSSTLPPLPERATSHGTGRGARTCSVQVRRDFQLMKLDFINCLGEIN